MSVAMCVCVYAFAQKSCSCGIQKKKLVCDCKPLCNHRLLEALFCYYHNKQKVIVKV